MSAGPTPKQKIILAVLGVLLVAVWGRALMGRPGKGEAPAPAVPGVPPPVSPVPAPSSGMMPGIAEGWGLSPFLAGREKSRPGSGKDASAAGLAGEEGLLLDGILWDPRMPSAIINNQVVCVGDRVGPWQVTEIKKDQVMLTDGTDTRTLRTF